MSKIVFIQGHPDPSNARFCHALANAYIEGAQQAGHKVDLVNIAHLDFPFLRTQEEWMQGAESIPKALSEAKKALTDADHVVLIYPLWLGTMPALVKGFLEQLLRPGIALDYEKGFPQGLLKGKSARIIITMGMPALAYRWYFMAHSLKNLERNVLRMVGIKPIRSTLLGMVESVSQKKRGKWLEQMRALGAQAK